MTKLSVITALIATSKAALVREAIDPATYSADLKCGGCINAGYNFCVQAVDGFEIAAGATPPATKCCRDETCAEATTSLDWTCSSSYADQTYSLEMCPFKKDNCGPKKTHTVDTEGDFTIDIAQMDRGETCMYHIKTNCGAPAFSAPANDDAVVDILMIKTFEFEGTVTAEPVGDEESKSQKKPKPGNADKVTE